jgi:glutaredoxin
MYTLSTCHHCRAAKKLVASLGVEFEFTDVDLLAGAEREATLAEVRRLNPQCSFPTILIGNQVIVGNNEEKIRKALGL